MKTLLGALLLLIGMSATAQTSVIHLKSHHGDSDGLETSEDKFGIPAPDRFIDTIERINETCVIHYVREVHWGGSDPMYYRDTVCNHWKYQEAQYDPKKIQKMYDDKVTLIGFDKDGSRFESKGKPFYKSKKKSSNTWIILLLTSIGLGAYIFQPRLSWKK